MTEEKKKALQEQSDIVKDRLHYHFSKIGGGWNIEHMNAPFMKEFLNEVEKLCTLSDGVIQNIDIESGLMEDEEKLRGIKLWGKNVLVLGCTPPHLTEINAKNLSNKISGSLSEMLKEEAEKTTDKLFDAKYTFDEGFKSGREQRRERRKEERKKK